MSFVHCLAGHSILREPYALIHATYPAGSKCTCSKSGTTLTAIGTGGTYAFAIPENGIWTVRAYDGATWASSTEKAEKPVTINSHYQVEAVKLSYFHPFLLYSNGTFYTPMEKQRYIPASATLGDINEYSDYVAVQARNELYSSVCLCTKNKIDLTDCSQLHASVKRHSALDGNVLHLAVSSVNANAYSGLVTYTEIVNPNTTYTAVLDVSSLRGEYYICIGAANTRQANYTAVRVYEIGLS